MSCCTVVDCYGSPYLKFPFDPLLFHLAQDLTGPQKILPLILKSGKNICSLKISKVAPQTKFVS